MNAQTGGFQTAGTTGASLTDRLADTLAIHVDAADIRAGIGTELDPGGNLAVAAAALRITEQVAEAMFNRICRKLGRQAV